MILPSYLNAANSIEGNIRAIQDHDRQERIDKQRQIRERRRLQGHDKNRKSKRKSASASRKKNRK